MRSQRSISLEFKRQIVEELLSGTSSAAQVCRRCSISSSLLYHWKKQYSRGKFNNEPTAEATLQDRVEQLERLVGKLTLVTGFFHLISGFFGLVNSFLSPSIILLISMPWASVLQYVCRTFLLLLYCLEEKTSVLFSGY